MMQHYTELIDIKRVVINTHAIEPQVRPVITFSFKLHICAWNACWSCFQHWNLLCFGVWYPNRVLCSLQALVEFFGTLSKEWALDCMKELLQVNMRGNLQIIVQVWSHNTCLLDLFQVPLISFALFSWKYVESCILVNIWGITKSCTLNSLEQVAKEYAEQLGVDSCVKLFETFKSYEGLYFFLGAYLSSRWVLNGNSWSCDVFSKRYMVFLNILEQLVHFRAIAAIFMDVENIFTLGLWVATAMHLKINLWLAFCVSVRTLRSTISILKLQPKLAKSRKWRE